MNDGIRIPLIVDGAMLMAVLWFAGQGYAQLDSLAGQVDEIQRKELPERIVSIDERLKAVEAAVNRSRQADVEQRRLLEQILRELENADN